MARQRRGGSATLDEVVKNGDGAAGDDTGGAEAAPAPAEAPAVARSLPTLPAAKTTGSATLEDKTVLIYGEPKIGKSTLASEWAGGKMFFFDCAGELNDLEVYRLPVTSWEEFRLTAAAYAEGMAKPKPLYSGCVVDTADVWATYCSHFARAKLGIVHESDAEWGKGWAMTKEELQLRLAKLMTLPGGVVLVSHSKEVEIKRRRQESYTRMIPTLTGGVREVVVNAADLVLFVDWAEDGESRVIYTKPDPSFEAGERSRNPRLPKQIAWPIGRSGWEVLKEAWDG